VLVPKKHGGRLCLSDQIQKKTRIVPREVHILVSALGMRRNVGEQELLLFWSMKFSFQPFALSSWMDILTGQMAHMVSRGRIAHADEENSLVSERVIVCRFAIDLEIIGEELSHFPLAVGAGVVASNHVQWDLDFIHPFLQFPEVNIAADEEEIGPLRSGQSLHLLHTAEKSIHVRSILIHSPAGCLGSMRIRNNREGKGLIQAEAGGRKRDKHSDQED
jgi:hypothetical protein